jgi:hypothetical protein
MPGFDFGEMKRLSRPVTVAQFKFESATLGKYSVNRCVIAICAKVFHYKFAGKRRRPLFGVANREALVANASLPPFDGTFFDSC